MGPRSRITGTYRWPFLLGFKGQRAGRRRSPTSGVAALRSFMAGHGSRGRALRNKRDWEVRGVHLRTEGSWRRSTGTWSRAAGSQVRNDRRLHRPSLKVASAALMTPVGNLSTASALFAIPPRGNLKPVSPLTPGVAATGSSTPWVLGLDPGSTFRSSRFPRAVRAHLGSRCEAHVGGVADVASVTSSCSPGVRWTDADLRHPSRCQPQHHSLRPQSCALVRGPHRESGLLDCCTVTLPREAPPAGVSFRSESLSRPGKG